MKRYAWAVLGLGLWVIGAGSAWGQAQRPPPPAELKQNYPNPFNPATTIPFALHGDHFSGGRQPVVSLKIYNVLGQLVAIPILQGSGQALNDLPLTCADASAGCTYAAYWDGKVLGTEREAASGVYLYQLVVNGQRGGTRKMLVMK
jgi:hypothetical protein